jgi:multicomponent Na+:H+ antiporter subunit D
MIYGIIGGLFIFVGVLLIYSNLGTLNFADISTKFNSISDTNKRFISIFFLFGLLIKLGVFPFHFWVAKAQSAAPSPISALLSGVVEKVYIYAFIRIFWFVFGFNILQNYNIDVLIITVALLSSIIGHFLALNEKDVKRILAYSTIGHLGIIIAAITVNTKIALIGGLLHVFSHLLMKISLFTTSGYLLQFTSTHKIKDSRGIARSNILIFSGFIIAAFGMVGIPPMLGFLSKLYIIRSFINNNFYSAGLIVILGSLIAFIYYFRYINIGFKKINLGSPEEFRLILSVLYRERLVTDIAIIFVVAIIFFGIFYQFILIPIDGIVEIMQNPSIYINQILGG